MKNAIVTRANGLVLGVLIAFILLVAGVTWERFDAAREARDWSRHSESILRGIKDLNIALRDAETGQRGYLLTGDADYLAPYETALARVGFLQGDLQRLTADNAAEQRRLKALAALVQQKLEELAQTVELRRSGQAEAAVATMRTGLGRQLMLSIANMLDSMETDQEARLAAQIGDGRRRGNWVRGLTALGTVMSVVGLLWAARLLNQAWRHASHVEAEQRRAALRLQTSFDSLSQGLAVFSADRVLVHWNDCFVALLDLPESLLRPGFAYDELVLATTTGDVAMLESPDQLRHTQTPMTQAITYERVQDGAHHLEFRRTGMPDGGFVLTVSDMTERVQSEAALRDSQKMQAIGQLTGGIAHDFNNLLTVILGNLEVLRRKLGPEHPLQNRIDRGVWAAERGATLTRQLLAFARKQPLAPAPIDLGAVVPALVPLLRRTLGEQVDVRCIETAGLWPAMADAAQVESALLNLALNARDAMPDGGRLTIELANKVLDEAYCRNHAEVAPGDYAMLAVTDTGHGMTPEVAARIFEPFFTTKSEGKGTGLGLAMVFGFVKQSGGHIKVYSEPGEGTTVRIYLPRAASRITPARRSSTPIDLPRGSATILVVEDEAAVREIACTILVELGYRVLEAVDGEEGLRVFMANAATVGMLLTDVVLPGALRGRELAERITALNPAIRVLFMSGYTENSIVHGGRLDDGVNLISKPFHRDQLARKVAAVLGLPSPVDAPAGLL